MERQPEDLIREYILLSVSGNFRLPPPDGKNDPRLRITQICSTWRRVAFTIPSLWVIKIITPTDGSINLANVWLRKSSGPATVAVPRLPSSSEFDSIFKNLIIPNISRLETLGPLKVDMPQWNQISSLRFDVLTKLHLLLDFAPSISPPNSLVYAPALREVLLGHLSGRGNDLSCVPELPWAQLTGLTLQGGLTAPELFALLPKCTSLERCEIETLIDPLGPPPSPDLSLHFQHLKSLCIIIAPAPSFLFDLLFSITFPQLSRLEINILPDSKVSLHRFIEHIRGIANTLRHFEILERPNERTVFEENIISAMPMLTHLILLPGYFLSPATLGKIRTGELLPNLQYLNFSVADGVQEVLNMLKGRQSLSSGKTHSSELKGVVIYNHGINWGDGLRGQLDVLKSSGMDVEVISRR